MNKEKSSLKEFNCEHIVYTVFHSVCALFFHSKNIKFSQDNFLFVISKEKDTLTWHPQLAEARGHIGIKRLAVIT